jgi:hypothetical protein
MTMFTIGFLVVSNKIDLWSPKLGWMNSLRHVVEGNMMW